ncbi:MAG TPA: NAD-binding protein, partial [Mycobacteriales bacterium]|nr:NAD-binding protein [Mycobacteriales bacterium]
MPPRIRRNASRRRNFVICGDNPLAHRLADELRGRQESSAADVTVILPSKRRNHGPQIARLDGVKVIEADDLSDEVLRGARLESADSIALVEQNDLGNIHVAMRVHELFPDLRIVIRVFDTRLGHYVAGMLGSCTPLSDSSVAAPWFVAEAMQQLTPNHIRVAGRTLRIATREEAGSGQVVCGLADLSEPGQPSLLPVDESRADLVLATTDGRSGSDDEHEGLLGEFRVPPWRAFLSRLHAMGTNSLTWFLIIFGVLLALVAICYVIVGYPPSNAIYLTILDAAGAADPDTKRGALEKVIQSVTAVLGISLIPALTASVIQTIVRRRFSETTRRLRIRNHVVIIGLGEVGSRVLQQLYDLGIPVVCV